MGLALKRAAMMPKSQGGSRDMVQDRASEPNLEM